MINLTPEQKLKIYRNFEANPSAGFLFALDLMSKGMEDKLETEMKKIQLELMQKLKGEIPNLDKILQTITGNDGEDAEPEEVAEILLKMPEFLELIKVEDGHTPTDEEIIALIEPRIPKVKDGYSPKKGIDYKDGIDGETPSDERLLKLITRLIPKVKDGITPTKEELVAIIKPLLDEIDIEEKDAATIVSEINKLPVTPDKQIDWEHIKNVPRKLFKESKKKGGGGGGDIIMTYDLSSLTDGVTKTFTVPYFRTAHHVLMSDGPALFLGLNNGFTVNAAHTQITLTVVNAPSTGSQLFFDYIL